MRCEKKNFNINYEVPNVKPVVNKEEQIEA